MVQGNASSAARRRPRVFRYALPSLCYTSAAQVTLILDFNWRKQQKYAWQTCNLI